jgi:hypothetical protein
MELSTAQEILVIILASALGIFLVLAIVVIVLVIRLLQTLRGIAKTAERMVHSAESAAAMLKNVSGPVGIFRFVRSMADMVAEHKRKK